MNICLGPGVTYLFVGLTCALNSVDYMHFKEQVWVPTTPRLFPLTVFMIFSSQLVLFFWSPSPVSQLHKYCANQVKFL